MKKLNCKRCNYRWVPRIDNPVVCPNCKSAYWNVARKNLSIKKNNGR